MESCKTPAQVRRIPNHNAVSLAKLMKPSCLHKLIEARWRMGSCKTPAQVRRIPNYACAIMTIIIICGQKPKLLNFSMVIDIIRILSKMYGKA